MQIIITSGGTSEPIDKVRKITNNSSGKLGSIIAKKLSSLNIVKKIYYVCSKTTILPTLSPNIELLTVTTADDVFNTLKSLIKSQKIDYVIHSMAVSDYKVDYITTVSQFSSLLENLSKEQIEHQLSHQNTTLNNDSKISSNKPDLIIKLCQTKKIISYIKQWDTDIKLIGFKLLVNVSKEKLIDVGYDLLNKNNCDYVVANDLSNINSTEHKSYLIDKQKQTTFMRNKQEIANVISQIVKGEKI